MAECQRAERGQRALAVFGDAGQFLHRAGVHSELFTARAGAGAQTTACADGCPREKICDGNRIAGGCRSAYAFQQMSITPKSVYLFLSSEKDFVAFCRILTKTRKHIDTIDSIGDTVFSMVSPNVP
jgi:hypothetical protein